MPISKSLNFKKGTFKNLINGGGGSIQEDNMSRNHNHIDRHAAGTMREGS